VLPNSAAAAAGLAGARFAPDGSFVPGDVITKVEGKAVDTVPALLARLDDFKIGEQVRLTVTADGKEREVRVTLQAEGQSERPIEPGLGQ
jgi:S1-C subfamily serine protease